MAVHTCMRENSFIPGTSPHPLACYTWSSCPAGWLVVRAPRPADDRSLKVAEIGRKPRHLLRKRSDPETNYPPPSPHKAQVASGGWLVFLAALPRTIVGPRKVHRTSVECSTSEARRRHNLAASAALSAFRFPLSAFRFPLPASRGSAPPFSSSTDRFQSVSFRVSRTPLAPHGRASFSLSSPSLRPQMFDIFVSKTHFPHLPLTGRSFSCARGPV